MNILKGFIEMSSLANNAPGTTAPFGELSTYSQTFSRTITNYANPTLAAAVELVGFTVKTDAGVSYAPTTTVTDHILSVAQWVYEQHIAGMIPANASKAAFITSLTTEFPDMTGVTINEILNGTPVTMRMPDFIEWHFDDSGTDHRIKVWFSDSRFRTQYDDYEILIIPPIDPIDDLNAGVTTVNLLLQQVRPADVVANMQTLIGTNPPTVVVTQPVVWHDQTLPTATLSTDWTAVIYGQAGNDADNIKQAILAYITANSTLTVWDEIFPGLYAENEFVVIPLWIDVAVPASGLDVALYSPMIEVGRMMSIASQLVPASYGQSVVLSSFLNSNLMMASAFWRSIAFMTVGNPNNVGSAYKFDGLYPDYMNIPTSSPDWTRMAVDTRNFIVQLNDALEKAMTLTALSTVPAGYTRTIRDGKVYLTFAAGGYYFLVLAKDSYSVS